MILLLPNYFNVDYYSILINIDAHIKIIHIDSLHTKLFRMSPKYQFLSYL